MLDQKSRRARGRGRRRPSEYRNRNDYRFLGVFLPVEVIEQIKRLCRREGINRTTFLERLVLKEAFMQGTADKTGPLLCLTRLQVSIERYLQNKKGYVSPEAITRDVYELIRDDEELRLLFYGACQIRGAEGLSPEERSEQETVRLREVDRHIRMSISRGIRSRPKLQLVADEYPHRSKHRPGSVLPDLREILYSVGRC